MVRNNFAYVILDNSSFLLFIKGTFHVYKHNDARFTQYFLCLIIFLIILKIAKHLLGFA